MPQTNGERLVALEVAKVAQDREIVVLRELVTKAMASLSENHDLIAPLAALQPELKKLLDTAKEARGAAALGKFLVGGTAFSVIGAAVLGVWHYFARGSL